MKSFVYLFLILPLTLSAQTTFAPEEANWNYQYSGHSPGFETDWSIKVINDSIVDGYPTKFLERTYLVTYSIPPFPPTGTVDEVNFGVLQERNDSIFYYTNYPNNGRFLYSFNMSIDDTITIDPSYPDLIAVVDTVYDTIIGGNTLSTWKLTKYCNEFGAMNEFGKTQIIEDIGPINDFLLWNTDGCPIGGGWWTFECYNSSSLSYNLPCAPMFLNIDDKDNAVISIYPNPASNVLIVDMNESSEVSVELISATGLVVYSKDNINSKPLSIPLDNLSNGCYSIIIHKGNNVVRERIAIIR